VFLAYLVTLGTLGFACAASAQSGTSGTSGAPAPIAPATVSRGNGGVTVRAVRLTSPLTVDGHLDEAVYRDVVPIDGFVQQEPREGEPASEATEPAGVTL
jgi:hypothetical protein